MDSLFLILYCVYGTISLVFLTRFLRNLSSLLKLISKNRILKNDLNIVLIKEDISPFSFFKYLFLNRSKYDKGLISKEILAHESIHGKQMHSLDILFIEVCLILFWFNPILWLYKNEISENQKNVFLHQEGFENIGKALNDLNFGKQLWQYMILLALLMLLFEILLIKLWK